MAQIQRTPLSRLSLTTMLSFGKSIEAKIDSSNLVKTDFKPHYDSFKSTLQILDDCNTRIINKQLTLLINQLAVKRSKIRTSIIKIILAYMNFNDDATVASATNLKNANQLFKDYYRKSHFQQTTIIAEYIKAVSDEIYTKDVEKLHLTEWIAHLNDINNEYAIKRLSRVEVKGTNNKSVKSSEARKLFIISYQTLWNRLNSLANVNGEDQYVELFAFWNALIDELRISISLSKGSGKGGKPSAGNDDKPNETSGPVKNESEDDRPVIESVNP